MTIKSHRLVTVLQRIVLSVGFGVYATTALFLIIVFLDLFVFKGDSMLPLEERMPLAWVLTWPDHLWRLFLNSSATFNAMILTHVAVFSLVAYIVIRRLSRRLRFS